MVTQKRLKELLRYDDESGRFFWVEKSGRGRKLSKNGEAGSYDSHGYGQVRIDGEIYKEHRLVWLYFHGEIPDKQIDHINHQRRDNRIGNLRLVTNEENAKNRPLQRNNSWGCPGISLHKKTQSFFAYIHEHGKRISLGYHRTIFDAACARKSAEVALGFSENCGRGFGVRKHKPNRFETYEDFQKSRTIDRRAKKACDRSI